MTPFEWIVVGVIAFNVIVGTIGGAIWKTQRDKIKNETVRAVIDSAVRAAEELDVSGQLKTSKQDYVWRMLEKQFPDVAKNRELVETLIHGAIHAAGLGSSVKSLK